MKKCADFDLSRRNLLRAAAAVPVGATLTACGAGSSDAGSSASASKQPNILFILVDQMRYPKVFPNGITTPDQFLQKYMPNTHNLWKSGVKFANYVTAATACGPSRSTLVTGLYTQQTWNTATIAPFLGNSPPALDPAYPTYGKLLKAAGYTTPYIGKWHLSPTPTAGAPTDMEVFGFQGLTEMDSLDAGNLQGTYGNPGATPTPLYSDDYIAAMAAGYLRGKDPTDQPWCLTVGLQNPHDYQFFPAGTEYKTYGDLFANTTGENPNSYVQGSAYAAGQLVASINWATNIFNTGVPQYGYPVIPPNWESFASLAANKPKWQSVMRQFTQMQFGGVSEAIGSTAFSVVQYPNAPAAYPGYPPSRLGIGLAPYGYWQRGLDAYTLAMTLVDQSIGKVLQALPADVAKNTVIIFSADHGDLVGAHGFISNKTGHFYDEAVRVPLIVSDPTGQFVGDTDKIRTQLTSAVDLTPMLVGFAYGGSTSWIQGDNATLYGQRFDMFPLLKSASASGRPYALYSVDECVSDTLDFMVADNAGHQTPWHVLGMVTATAKLGIYTNWQLGTATVISGGQEHEYYDYTTAAGLAETANTYSGNAAAASMKDKLLNQIIPNEMRAPLPSSMQTAQSKAYNTLIAYYATQETSGLAQG